MCRGTETRTRDLLLPKQARYQLRHAPPYWKALNIVLRSLETKKIQPFSSSTSPLTAILYSRSVKHSSPFADHNYKYNPYRTALAFPVSDYSMLHKHTQRHPPTTYTTYSPVPAISSSLTSIPANCNSFISRILASYPAEAMLLRALIRLSWASLNVVVVN